jgi:hypothetical protein
MKHFVRRAWPWAVGIAILAVIITRVPVAAFRSAIGHGPHLALAGVNLAIGACTLTTESFATWVGLIALRLRRPFADIVAVRGATYAVFLVNYALGQGAFGYYLHKSGTTGRRAVGATLFLIGTNLGALLILTTIAVLVGDVTLPSPQLVLTLEIACGALACYLVLIAISPGPLARREVFAPLFGAGVRGHALAILGRVPHVAVLVFGQWVALRVWGVPVPLETGLVVMPIVVIASVLPISPAGLGTTQAAMVYLFSAYAAGATVEDRQAAVLAFGIVHFVYGVAASVLVGLVFMPIAKRRGVLVQRPAT